MMNEIEMKEYIAIAKEQIVKGLDEFNEFTYNPVDYGEEFVRKLAKDSVRAKEELISILSKHKHWNKELMSVIIPSVMEQVTDWDKVMVLLREFQDDDAVIDENTGEILFFFSPRVITAILRKEDMGIWNERIREKVKEICGRGWMEKKPSKILMSICKFLNLTEKEGFNKWYAVIADELSAKPQPYTLYISVNPAHFLTISNPKNQKGRSDLMTSCHSLNGYITNDCCYAGGNSGYAKDKVTMVVFTVPKGRDCLNSQKISRQLFHYENGVLLQNRLYIAKSNDSYGGVHGREEHKIEIDSYRNIVQAVISECEEIPNLWKVKSYSSSYFPVHDYFSGYADWRNFEGLMHLTYNKEKVEDEDFEDISIEIGEVGLCLQCGGELDGDNDSPVCKDCSGDTWCECCEEYVREDHVRYIEGYGYVCDDCLENNNNFIYCEYHDEWEYIGNDGYYHIEDYGDVCEDAYERGSFFYCEDCDCYYSKDDGHYIEDENRLVCDSCYNDGDYFYCAKCGYYYSGDYEYEVRGGDGVCESCLEKYYTYCDRCEEYVPNKDIALENENENVCKDCLTEEELLHHNMGIKEEVA